LAVIFFEFVLAVSGLRIFQQDCFLYSNKLLQANVPVTPVSQPASAEKRVKLIELQTRHCMKPE